MQVHSPGKQTAQIGKISGTLRTHESVRTLKKCVEPLFLELLFLKEHLLFSQTSLVHKTPEKHKIHRAMIQTYKQRYTVNLFIYHYVAYND